LHEFTERQVVVLMLLVLLVLVVVLLLVLVAVVVVVEREQECPPTVGYWRRCATQMLVLQRCLRVNGNRY
jgi:hypothetical protein